MCSFSVAKECLPISRELQRCLDYDTTSFCCLQILCIKLPCCSNVMTSHHCLCYNTCYTFLLLEFIRSDMSGAEQSADSSAVMNFGRQLAASEKETRDKALRKVRKWLSSAPSGTFLHRPRASIRIDRFNLPPNHIAISENEMLKLWMGLYMTMWMADKPLIQVIV